MITTTVADVVKGYSGTTQGHYLYLYRDGEAILYVGKSIRPLERLLQHLGHDVRSLPDAIGLLIQDNLPNSLFWTVELYTRGSRYFSTLLRASFATLSFSQTVIPISGI